MLRNRGSGQLQASGEIENHFMKEELRISEWIAAFLSGEISEPDRQALMDWVARKEENKTYFREMVTIWERAEDVSESEMFDAKDAWQKIESQVNSAKIVPLWQFNFLKIAASLLILLGLTLWIWRGNSVEMTTIQTASNEQKEVQLPDGSWVWLNENSTLVYPTNFEKRELNLSGEAYFEVTKLNGKTFEIIAGATKTTVLGTAFNVRAYSGEGSIEVKVNSGKVSFEKREVPESKVILEKDEVAISQDETAEISKQKLEHSNADSWHTKSLAFTAVPMSEVVEDLERYFKVRITVSNPDILNCSFTGIFQNPDKVEIINTIQFAMNLQIDEQGDVWMISGDGCK